MNKIDIMPGMAVEVQARPKIEYDDRVDWDKLPYSVTVDTQRWASTLHFLGMSDRDINKQEMLLDPKSRPLTPNGQPMMGSYNRWDNRTNIYTRYALIGYSLPMDHAYRQTAILNATIDQAQNEDDFQEIRNFMKSAWEINLDQREFASRQDFTAHLADETVRQTVDRINRHLTGFVHHESQHAADHNNMYMSWPTLVDELIHQWVNDKPSLFGVYYKSSLIEIRARRAQKKLAEYPGFENIVIFTPKTAQEDTARIVGTSGLC